MEGIDTQGTTGFESLANGPHARAFTNAAAGIRHGTREDPVRTGNPRLASTSVTGEGW
jgi:hypothetical protein